jgi:Na+/H+-dicarboxylate symporter
MVIAEGEEPPPTAAGGSPMRVLAALLLGLGIGVVAFMSGSAAAIRAAGWLEPVGILWVNAIRMTVLPLVVASLVVAVSDASPRTVGRLGTRAFFAFLFLLVMLALFGALVVPPIFARLTIDPAVAQALRASAATTQRPELPSFVSWLVSLVPTNPMKAAADGAMLPLVVFTLALGLALGRLDAATRAPVVGFFRGVSEAMTVLVRWVLALAPIGVFALALSLATKLGTDIIGAVAFYIVAMCALLIVSALLLYAVVALFAPPSVSLRLFARAVLPAQVVAMTTRSSIAALPVQLTKAERVLGLPRTVTSFVLPLASSTFRYVQPLTWQAYALFGATLYGVHLGAPEIATIAVASVLLSFSVPGIPSGGLYVIAPFLAAVGIPAECVGVLIALDLVPDVFKSLTNATAHMTAAVLVTRGETALTRDGVAASLETAFSKR